MPNLITLMILFGLIFPQRLEEGRQLPREILRAVYPGYDPVTGFTGEEAAQLRAPRSILEHPMSGGRKLILIARFEVTPDLQLMTCGGCSRIIDALLLDGSGKMLGKGLDLFRADGHESMRVDEKNYPAVQDVPVVGIVNTHYNVIEHSTLYLLRLSAPIRIVMEATVHHSDCGGLGMTKDPLEKGALSQQTSEVVFSTANPSRLELRGVETTCLAGKKTQRATLTYIWDPRQGIYTTQSTTR